MIFILVKMWKHDRDHQVVEDRNNNNNSSNHQIETYLVIHPNHPVHARQVGDEAY